MMRRVGEWAVLVGRDAEFARVLKQLDSPGGGVVLAGPAGVGKTRLAAECMEAAAARGFLTLRAAATQAASTLPFGALAALLPDLSPGTHRLELLHQVANAIAERGDGKPVALLVDDAHLLDDASAALVHQLVIGRKVFVLVTVRSGEAASDAVMALWKDGLTERVELQPFGEREVTDILGTVLGGPVEGGLSHLLFRQSAGNVLFLRELVLGALEAGVLREEHGLWRLGGALPTSARLVELIEARLAGLAPDDREALEVLSIGEPVGAALFARFCRGMPVVALERRGLIRVEQDGRRLDVRLGHPLYGDVLRAVLSPLQAQTAARGLADVLEEVGSRRRDDVLRLAAWRLDAAGQPKPATLLAAAHQARALHDLRLAERLAKAALDAGGGFEAELLVAQIFSLTGRGEEAERRMAGLVPHAVSDAHRGQLAVARIDNLSYTLGRLEEGVAVAQDAEASIADPNFRDELTAHHASLLDNSGQTAKALRLSADLVERAEGWAGAWGSVMATWGYAKTGQLSKALAVSEQGLETFRALSGPAPPWGASALVAVRYWALMFGGQLHEAEELALAEYRRGVSDQSVETRWYISMFLANVYVARGRLAAAIRWGREAAALGREHTRLTLLRMSLMPLAEALALTGQSEESNRVLAEIDSLHMPSIHLADDELSRVRGWTAVAEGDLVAARKLFREAAARAADVGDHVFELAGRHDSARVGDTAAFNDRLHELADMIEGPFGRARAAHAAALAGRDPGGLEAASTAFEELGAGLLAAEAAADAAVAWRAAGDLRKANAAERHALDLAGECEGARTPALTVAASTQATLSRRELEIAQLAALGLPNKEIATRLSLSVRTVENKLHIAYEKLGIGGRDQLAKALERATAGP
jgi:DNA-binding CsgD family transcriptional regulator